MHKVIYILIPVLLFSCSPDTLSLKEFDRWINDPSHGLTVSKELPACVVDVQLQPAEYVACKQNLMFKKINDSLVSSANNNSIVIKWKIRLKQSSQDILSSGIFDPYTYDDLVSYFSFYVSNDIEIKYAQQEINCMHHNFERTYGLSPYVVFTSTFELPESEYFSDDIVFTFRAEKIGLGILHFKFDKDNLNNIPEIKD